MTRNVCPAMAVHRSETCSRASVYLEICALPDNHGSPTDTRIHDRRYSVAYCNYYEAYVRRNTRRLALAPERPCTVRCPHYQPYSKLQ